MSHIQITRTLEDSWVEDTWSVRNRKSKAYLGRIRVYTGGKK